VGTTSGRPRDDAGRNRHASLIARISNPEYPMCPETMRQSDRVSLRLQVDASWFETGGVAVDHEPDGFIYAIAMLEPGADFWEIEFPAPHKAEEALARLLMECSFCERREVVYLNEMELKSFEIRRCVARLCKHCDSPSIWVEAQSDTKDDDTLSPHIPSEERVVPRRNRTRVKARVLACIRRRGFQEEVAVCEDLSKGGISFRSRNHYPEGTRLEVAVPYTPGAGAIFVPIRIVFSQPISSAGLFRHGAAYLRPPD